MIDLKEGKVKQIVANPKVEEKETKKDGIVTKVDGFDYGSTLENYSANEKKMIPETLTAEWLRVCVGMSLIKMPIHPQQLRDFMFWAQKRYCQGKLSKTVFNEIFAEVWRNRRHKGSEREEAKNRCWILRRHTTYIETVREAIRVSKGELRKDFYMGTLEIKCEAMGFHKWTPLERDTYAMIRNYIEAKFILISRKEEKLSDNEKYPKFVGGHFVIKHTDLDRYIRGIAAENEVVVFYEDYLKKLPKWRGIAACEKMITDPLTKKKRRQGWHPSRSTIVKVFEKYLKFDKDNQVSRELMRFAFPAGMRAAVRRQIFQEEYAFDYLTVVIGKQGIGKSKMWRYMLPSAYEGGKTGWVVSSLRFDAKGGDPVELATRLKGAVIAEARECIGLRTCDLERIKAIIDTDIDQERFKYGEFRGDQKRTCWMVGNSNDMKVLPGEWDGSRRMIAIILNNEMEDDEATAKMYAELRNMRDEMWAEALYLAEQREWDPLFFIIPERWETVDGKIINLRDQQKITSRHHSTDWEIMEILRNIVRELKPQKYPHEFTLKSLASIVSEELGIKMTRGTSRKIGEILDSFNGDPEIQKFFDYKIVTKRGRIMGEGDTQQYAGMYIKVIERVESVDSVQIH